MKKKIEKIKGKRLVIGNVNELGKNEILVQYTKDGLITLKEKIGGELKEISINSNSTEGGDTNRTITIRSINHYDESQQEVISLDIPTGIVTWLEYIESKTWPSEISFETDDNYDMLQIYYYEPNGNYGLLTDQNGNLVDANDNIIFGAEYKMQYS
jgi:hypothetical protein